MRLVEIQAMNLEPGMFVAELDRPWLETPFSLQGFVVRDYDDIEFISKYVQHVFVDAEYKGTREFLRLATAPTARDNTDSLLLKSEFQQTKVSFESATESIMLENQEIMLNKLSQFREMGVRVSIDDFGTGFSSLAYFGDLPADEIKIDKCFVIPMLESEKGYLY